MKLMFLHPVDYGRKAEELLWRKVYYEVIQVIKTNKKVPLYDNYYMILFLTHKQEGNIVMQ